jgi:hypothetical protein
MNPIKMINAAMPIIIRFFLPNAKLVLDIYFVLKFQIVDKYLNVKQIICIHS